MVPPRPHGHGGYSRGDGHGDFASGNDDDDGVVLYLVERLCGWS